MNISLPIPSTVKSVSFSVLTTEDIRRISVKQITNPVLLDGLNRPNLGGLYDPALGPVEKQDMSVFLPFSSANIFLISGQLRDVQRDIFHLSRSLWSYRLAGTSFPSALHESYVQFAKNNMFILSSLQVIKTRGARRLFLTIGFAV